MRAQRREGDASRSPADSRPAVRKRGFVEVRWRQLRNPPPPILRAVLSSLTVALVAGLLYLAYDVSLARGARLPGGDLRVGLAAAYTAVVLVAGTAITYLVVPQPGPVGARRRSAWSAALGFFAAVPIAYLVLVALTQIVEPFLV